MVPDDMTPEERKDWNARWFQAWRHSQRGGMGENGNIFPTADTTTPRMVLQWVPVPQEKQPCGLDRATLHALNVPHTFHWKVVFMGSYADATQRIRTLREQHLAVPHPYERYGKIPPVGIVVPDAADFILVKQA